METPKPHFAPSRNRRFRFIFWTILLLVVIAYSALQVFVRTDAFRTQVEEELSNLVGMEVRIGRMRASENLNLKIRDMIGISDVAGIEARVARIRWRLFRPRGTPMLESIRVDGLALTIGADESGNIQPAFIGKISQSLFAWTGLPMPAELSAATSPTDDLPSPAASFITPRTLENQLSGPLQLLDVSIRWRDAQGQLGASVTGMYIIWAPLVTPKGRRVAHLDIQIAEIQLANGPKITDLHLELVSVEDQWFLVNLDAVDWGGNAPPPSPSAAARELLDAM